jgi:V/A-type H+-transporting ATPase subunit A
VTDFFKKLINLCKQLNYSQFQSAQYKEFMQQIEDMIGQAA